MKTADSCPSCNRICLAIKSIESVLSSSLTFTHESPECHLATKTLEEAGSSTCQDIEGKIDHVIALVEESKKLPLRLARAQQTLSTLSKCLSAFHRKDILTGKERQNLSKCWRGELGELQMADLVEDVLKLSRGDQVLWSTSLLAFEQLFELLPQYHRILDDLQELEQVVDEHAVSAVSIMTDEETSTPGFSVSEAPLYKLTMTNATLLSPIYKGQENGRNGSVSSLCPSQTSPSAQIDSDDIFSTPIYSPKYLLTTTKHHYHGLESDGELDTSLPEINFTSVSEIPDFDSEEKSVPRKRLASHSMTDGVQNTQRIPLSSTNDSPSCDTSLDLSLLSDLSVTDSQQDPVINNSYDFLRLPPQTPPRKSKSLSLNQRVGKIVHSYKMQVSKSTGSTSSTSATRRSSPPQPKLRARASDISLRSNSSSLTNSPSRSNNNNSNAVSDTNGDNAGWFTIRLSARTTKDLYCRIVGTCVMVRVGGGWEELASFLMNWAMHHTGGGGSTEDEIGDSSERSLSERDRREWAEMTFVEASDQLLGPMLGPDDLEMKGREDMKESRNSSRGRVASFGTTSAKMRKNSDGRTVFEA